MGDFNIRTGCINYFNDMNDYKAHGGDFVYDIVPLSYFIHILKDNLIGSGLNL